MTLSVFSGINNRSTHSLFKNLTLEDFLFDRSGRQQSTKNKIPTFDDCMLRE